MPRFCPTARLGCSSSKAGLSFCEVIQKGRSLAGCSRCQKQLRWIGMTKGNVLAMAYAIANLRVQAVCNFILSRLSVIDYPEHLHENMNGRLLVLVVSFNVVSDRLFGPHGLIIGLLRFRGKMLFEYRGGSVPAVP